MLYGTLGAATMSVVVLSGGFAGAQESEQRPLSRTLTVEQTAVYDVRPTVQAQGGLDVVAWVDRSDYTYASGEDVKLFVETSKDAYVTILNVDPAGETTILFPNQYQSANLVRANRVLEVPDPASSSRIVVTGTTGTELIKVIASTQDIQPFEAQQLSAAGAFKVLRTRAQGAARSLKVAMNLEPKPVEQRPVTQSVTAVPSTEWAMCHQRLSTISDPAPALQRTRSLQVTRTSESRGSASCDEAR